MRRRKRITDSGVDASVDRVTGNGKSNEEQTGRKTEELKDSCACADVDVGLHGKSIMTVLVILLRPVASSSDRPEFFLGFLSFFINAVRTCGAKIK